MQSPSSTDEGPLIGNGYDFEISSSKEDLDDIEERNFEHVETNKQTKKHVDTYKQLNKHVEIRPDVTPSSAGKYRVKIKQPYIENKISTSSASSKLDTRIDTNEVREIRTYEKWLLRMIRPSSKSLRTFTVIAGFLCATYYIHMYLQYQYYQRCKSNVFRVVLFKESHMCTHLANVLNVIENTYFVGMKRFIDAILLPLYNTGLPSMNL